MIEPPKSSVRIVYLEMDPAPQMPGEETFYAVLDPFPSGRWKAAFTQALRTGPELVREATFRTFHGKATLRFTVPEQQVTGAIQALKAQVLAVGSRTVPGQIQRSMDRNQRLDQLAERSRPQIHGTCTD